MLVIWKNGTLTTRIRVHHKVVYATLRIILVVLNFLPREEYSVTNVISANSLRFAHFLLFSYVFILSFRRAHNEKLLFLFCFS